MVSVLASSALDHWLEPQLGQAKDYKIGICRFSGKHAALRKKNKDWLAQNQNKVFSSKRDYNHAMIKSVHVVVLIKCGY